MMVTSYHRVEMNGRTYEVKWYNEHATVMVETKSGPRTMNGRGRANRAAEAAAVIAKSREEGKGKS